MRSFVEDEREVKEVAALLIARFGERATSYARYQSLKAARDDQRRTMEAWRRVADAADQVWKIEPA